MALAAGWALRCGERSLPRMPPAPRLTGADQPEPAPQARYRPRIPLRKRRLRRARDFRAGAAQRNKLAPESAIATRARYRYRRPDSGRRERTRIHARAFLQYKDVRP